jgi:hypothetical protein
VASPAQVSALLDAVTRTRPELAAFFGCLYYTALRPEEAVALRLADCHLPGSGWGMLRLAAAAPRTAAAWTSDGTGYEQRGLKHRPDGAIRMVPAPSELVTMLRAHQAAYGTAPGGRLFRGTRGGPLSGALYGRAWQSRPRPRPRARAGRHGLARRLHDLRHAALSLWLNAGGDPAQIAARAGNSVAVLLNVYTHYIHGHHDLLNQQISHALGPLVGGPRLSAPVRESQRRADRAPGADAVRYTSVDFPARPAHGPQTTPAPHGHEPSQRPRRHSSILLKANIRTKIEQWPAIPIRPTASPQTTASGPRNLPLETRKPVTPDDVTGPDLRNQGGRCWVRTNVG